MERITDTRGLRRWLRAALATLPLLAGCAGLGGLPGGRTGAHQACARLCDDHLRRGALGYADGDSACVCYAPLDAWETLPRPTTARITLSQGPILAARQ